MALQSTTVAKAALTLLAALAYLPFDQVQAKDQVLDWSLNMTKGHGQIDVLQCQSVVFDWTTTSSSDGGYPGSSIKLLHDVMEFPDEHSFDSCDFANAVRLADATQSGKLTVLNDDTLLVTKRWFGSRVGDQCSRSRMKVSVKIRPRFVTKFVGSECAGGTIDVTKDDATLKECRKRCKRRRGCVAIQFDSSVQDGKDACKTYKTAPDLRPGVANYFAQCEIARGSCDDDGYVGNEATADAAPTRVVPMINADTGGAKKCNLEMKVECVACVTSGCEGTDCNYWGKPNGNYCEKDVRWRYTYKNVGNNLATIIGLERNRPGDVNGEDYKFPNSNYLLPGGYQ